MFSKQMYLIADELFYNANLSTYKLLLNLHDILTHVITI